MSSVFVNEAASSTDMSSIVIIDAAAKRDFRPSPPSQPSLAKSASVQQNSGSSNSSNSSMLNSSTSSSIGVTSAEAECSRLMAENVELRGECEQLRAQLAAKQSSAATAANNNKSELGGDDERFYYVNVNEDTMHIYEKIESHFSAANKLFVDKRAMCSAIDYLIRSIWSIVAAASECDNYDKPSSSSSSSSHLNEFKASRDELLAKLHRHCNEHQPTAACSSSSSLSARSSPTVAATVVKRECSLSSSSMRHSNMTSNSSFESIKSELDSCRVDGVSLKHKVLEQNKMIRAFLTELTQCNAELSSATAATAAATPSKQDAGDDSLRPSPGTSPTSGLLAMLSRQQPKQQQQQQSFIQTNEAVDDDYDDESQAKTLEPDVTAATPASAPVATPTDATKNANDFYYYNTNGYIAIDNTLQYVHDNNNQLSDDAAPQPRLRAHQQQQVQPQKRQSTLISDDDHDVAVFVKGEPQAAACNDALIYQCPKCQVSIEAQQIAFDVYERHVAECDMSKYHVCVFCLRLFDKSLTSDRRFEAHINRHLVFPTTAGAAAAADENGSSARGYDGDDNEQMSSF